MDHLGHTYNATLMEKSQAYCTYTTTDKVHVILISVWENYVQELAFAVKSRSKTDENNFESPILITYQALTVEY